MTFIREGAINRYIGLSTDVKPVGVPVGSIYTESDTACVYFCKDGTNWFLQRIIVRPYMYAIAEGDIPNHSLIRKIGWQSAVSTSEIDLWGVVAAYVPPSAPMQMSVRSSDNTQDLPWAERVRSPLKFIISTTCMLKKQSKLF